MKPVTAIIVSRLDDFDKQTGIEQLRTIVKALSNCRESALDPFTVTQLVKLYRAWLGSEWTFYPDEWTPRQLREALRGVSPCWDEQERPVYRKRSTAKPVTYGTLPEVPAKLVLRCPQCRATFSANRSDYFTREPSERPCCRECDQPLRLVTRGAT